MFYSIHNDFDQLKSYMFQIEGTSKLEKRFNYEDNDNFLWAPINEDGWAIRNFKSKGMLDAGAGSVYVFNRNTPPNKW